MATMGSLGYQSVCADPCRPDRGGFVFGRCPADYRGQRECDISLGNTYYMGAMLEDSEQAEWANSVRIEFPTFADNGTSHVNVSGVAMTASAPNRDNAVSFMEFLSSPGAQAIYASVVYEYPASPAAKASELVASWGDFTPDDTNLTAIASHRAQALQMVERVDFDGGAGSGG